MALDKYLLMDACVQNVEKCPMELGYQFLFRPSGICTGIDPLHCDGLFSEALMMPLTGAFQLLMVGLPIIMLMNGPELLMS